MLETNTTLRIRIRTTMSQPQPEEVMHQVQAELANAYAQEFFTTVREKCFKLCVSKPSSSLSSYERKCLEQCTERYVDATRMISQVVLKQYSKAVGLVGCSGKSGLMCDFLAREREKQREKCRDSERV